MRLIHHLAAFALLGQLTLAGGVSACERRGHEPRVAVAGEQTGGAHAAHRAHHESTRRGHDQPCDHAANVAGCGAAMGCVAALTTVAGQDVRSLTIPRPRAAGDLLAGSERSVQPELPPPRA